MDVPVAPAAGSIEVDGLQISHIDQGAGDPVLLVHGLGSSGFMEWRFTISRLSRRYRVVAPDLPGHGESAKPAGVRYDMDFFAGRIIGLMDALEIPSAHVVGASLGGRIALELALEAPERVRSLTLVNSLGLGRPGTLQPYALIAIPRLGEWAFSRLQGPLAKITPRQLAWIFSMRYHDGRRGRELADAHALAHLHRSAGDAASGQAYLSILRELRDRFGLRRGVVATDRLDAITTATLIVWGRNDGLFPVRHAYAAHAAIAGSELRVIDRCGHNPQLEQPELFNRILLDFLSTASPGD